MKESPKTESLKSGKVDTDILGRILREKKKAEQAVFDAHDKETLTEANEALSLILVKEKNQIEIEGYKKTIDEINEARTIGKLSFRYGIAEDYEKLANFEVDDLEARIHYLENQSKAKKVFNEDEEKKDNTEEERIQKIKDDVEPGLEENEKDDGDNKKKTEPEKPENKKPKSKPKEEKDKIEPEAKVPEAEKPEEEKVKKESEEEKPEESNIEKRRRMLGAVKTDSREKRAEDIAAERMTADKNSLKGVSGFFKKIWKHNWGAEILRIREASKIRKELASMGSAFSLTDVSGANDRVVKEAVLKRFLEDGTDLIHLDAGEQKDNLSKEKKDKAEAALQDAVRRYASAVDPVQAELDFLAERDRIYIELYAKKKLFGREDKDFDSVDIADNIFEFAKEMRAQVEHGVALSDLDLDFELTCGEAKTGVRTEAQYSWTEKMVKKVMGSHAGRFINETTLAAAISLIPTFTKTGSSMAARSAFFVGGAVVAGAVAGIKESAAMKRDKKEHARAMASGRSFDASRAPRRLELESTMYQMLNVKTSTENLHNMLFENVGGIEKPRILSQSDIANIMFEISHIDSRIALSDKERIDLLAYSDEAMVEVERTNLDFERYKAKIILQDEFAKNPALGNFKDRMDTLISARENEIRKDPGGIEEKDAAFKKIKRTHVSKAMTKGVIRGILIGGAVQEIASIWNGQDGLVDAIRGTGNGQHLTSLEWVREKICGVFGGGHNLSNQGIETVLPGKEILSSAVVLGVAHDVHSTVNSFITLPEDYELNPSGSHAGVYDVFHEGKNIAHVEVDSSTGELTSNSITELKEVGFDIDTGTSHTASSVSSGAVGGKVADVQDFVHEHSDKFTKIKRLGWADNGTVRPDQNELKLWDPIEKNGQYEFAVKMNQTGSVFNGQHIDPVKLASEGKLKALFSLSRDTQGHPFEVPVTYEAGKMTISVDPNDPILGQLFHKAPNGEIICDARFVEVGAEMGEKNGVKEFVMCATEEGKGLSSINGVGEKIDDFIQTNVKTDISMPNNPDVYLPPVIPLLPRTPLEPTKTGKVPPPPYYGFASRPEDIKRWKESQSETLSKDPYAKLEQLKEIDAYFDKEKKSPEFGDEYLEELDKRIDENGLDSVVTSKTKVVVCMPVHGPSEAENIYKTLALYAKQGGGALDKTAFMLNVNWREFEKDSSTIQKTLDEIKRAKKDFPQLRIGFFKKEWSQELVVRKNGRLYGTVVKHLNDTVLRLISKKRLADDVYLLTNDADCRGMSSHYLSDVLEAGNKEPEKDGFLGRLEWGTEKFTQYPGYHVSMRVMQYLGAVKRNSKLLKDKYVESSGANFACKASTFAAVGGYESSIGAGADTDLGKKIRYARGGEQIDRNPDSKSYPISYVNSAWLDTDPERGLSYYLDGKFIGSMWDDFDSDKGYTPRTDLKVSSGKAESLEDFDTISERIEYQLNEFIRQWYKDERVFVKALNHLMPPQKGKPTWINKGTATDPKINLTKEGRLWLKKQLEDYAFEGKADTKYNGGRGFRS